MCEEVTCAAFTLSEWVQMRDTRAGIVSGNGTDRCNPDESITLNTNSHQHCSIQCDEGYSGLSDKGITTSCSITCAADAKQNSPVTTDLQCRENACSMFTFETDDYLERTNLGDPTIRQCYEGTPLTTHTNRVCKVQCQEGTSMKSKKTGLPWSMGEVGEVYCPVASLNGASPETDFICVENSCEALQMPIYAMGTLGIVGGGTPSCTNGMVLSTINNNQCLLSCKPGYTGQSALTECNIAAVNTVDQPIHNLDCTENKCKPLQFPVGADRTEGAGGIPTCKRGGILGTHTENNCLVKCGAGYSGQPIKATCSEDSLTDEDVVLDLNCSVAVVSITLKCAGDGKCSHGPDLDEPKARTHLLRNSYSRYCRSLMSST